MLGNQIRPDNSLASPWLVPFYENFMDDSFNQRLSSLRPLYEWHEHHLKRGGVLFPTFTSLKWFVRQHGDELEKAGVLLRGKGGRTNLVTLDFGKVVYTIFFSPKEEWSS